MRRAVCLTVALVFVAAASAQAAPVVATDGAYALHASIKDGRLCLNLSRGEEADAPQCERIPRTPSTAHVPLLYAADYPVSGAVPPSVAYVTVGATRVDTVAAAGFRPRFFLIAEPADGSLARLFAADGTLLGAAEVRQEVTGTRRGRVVLAHARGVVRVRPERELVPTVFERDRVVDQICLDGDTPGAGTGICVNQAPETAPLTYASSPACAPGQSVVFGVARPGVARVTLRLGGGRELATTPRALPARYDGWRALAVSIPRGEAVRSVGAVDSQGVVLGRGGLGLPPSGLPCETAFNAAFQTTTLPPRPPDLGQPAVVGAAGGHRFLVADAAGELCAGLDRVRFRDCTSPLAVPLDSAFPFLEQRRGTVAGVLGADAATVDLIGADGVTRFVPTTDGAAYTGRYAGRVRFVFAAVPGRVLRAVVRDASGARLGRNQVIQPARPDKVLRRVARGPGYSITVDKLAEPDLKTPLVCLTIREGGVSTGAGTCDVSGTPVLDALVECRPRHAFLYGDLPNRATRVAVRLGGNRSVAARIVRFRGRAFWFAVVPGRAAVRAIRFAPGSEVKLPLPPARRQCGYFTAAEQ